jgi:hypothetical protein
MGGIRRTDPNPFTGQFLVVKLQIKLRRKLTLHLKINWERRVLVSHVQFLGELETKGMHSVPAVQNGNNILPRFSMT